MPLYEYRCTDCGAMTQYLRPVAQRNDPAFCPDCGAVAKRIISKLQRLTEVNMTPNEILRDREVWR
jgi:putative FmdB family regulatory protein